ncbi:hypothetical protein BTM410_15050 [Helicobacter pylori]
MVNDAFYFAMCFILIYLGLFSLRLYLFKAFYLFKALFIQGSIYLKLVLFKACFI